MSKILNYIEIADELLEIQDKRLDRIVNKVGLVIGDSYGLGWTQNPAVSYTPYSDYAATMTGITIHNISESGAGFAHIGNNGHIFSNLLNLLDRNIDKSSITDIYAMGGYNDRIESQTSIREGIIGFVNMAALYYPNAKVHIGFICWDKTAINYPSLYSALEAYKDAPSFGASYMDGIEYIMHDQAKIFNDGIHPNEQGQISLGVGLASYINNATIPDTQVNALLALTGHNGCAFSNAMRQSMDNGIGTWGFYEPLSIANMTAFSAHLLDGTTMLNVGEIDSQVGCLRGYYEMETTIPAVISTVNNGLLPGHITFRVVNGIIYIGICAVNNGAYITDQINSVTINGFIASTNTLLN